MPLYLSIDHKRNQLLLDASQTDDDKKPLLNELTALKAAMLQVKP